MPSLGLDVLVADDNAINREVAARDAGANSTAA